MEFIGIIFNLFVYNPMLNAMLFLYPFIPNYGVAIIVFTVIVGLLTMPFRIKSQQSMKAQQEKMAALKPRLDEIKKKYKDNPQELPKAADEDVSGERRRQSLQSRLSLTLLPFPIFIGMYQVINGVMAEPPRTGDGALAAYLSQFSNAAR